MKKPQAFTVYLSCALRLAGMDCDERHAALIVRLFYLVRRLGGTCTMDDVITEKAEWAKAYPAPEPAPAPVASEPNTQD